MTLGSDLGLTIGPATLEKRRWEVFPRHSWQVVEDGRLNFWTRDRGNSRPGNGRVYLWFIGLGMSIKIFNPDVIHGTTSPRGTHHRRFHRYVPRLQITANKRLPAFLSVGNFRTSWKPAWFSCSENRFLRGSVEPRKRGLGRPRHRSTAGRVLRGHRTEPLVTNGVQKRRRRSLSREGSEGQRCSVRYRSAALIRDLEDLLRLF